MNEAIAGILSGLTRIGPEAVLVAAACLLFLGATFRVGRHLGGSVALLSLAAAGVALWFTPLSAADADAVQLSPLYVDGLAFWVKVVALVAAAVLVLASWDEVPDAHAAEYHACLLALTAGLCLTGSANDLVLLFLALELISIPTYILLYLPRADTAAQEAAMKYFLLSVFSSALLLFGFSYLYGVAGTTSLPAIISAVAPVGPIQLPAVTLVAAVMIIAGLGFKITAVPFHFYAPDVYQGATPSAAALLAFVPKVAGIIALIRVLGLVPHAVGGSIFEEGQGAALGEQVPRLLWILAVVTMSLGNILALLQDNLKRILAYSSVAHAGYMLMGICVARFDRLPGAGVTTGGVDAVLFYLVAYGMMTIGAFSVLCYVSTPQRPVETVDDLAGLGVTRPGVALAMVLFLFSLIGIPLTAGFAGKFLLFWGAMLVIPDSSDPLWFRVLALIAAINAAIGGWYYLRIAAAMYFRRPARQPERAHPTPALAAVITCALLTLAVGLYPPVLLDTIRAALPQNTAGPGLPAKPPPER